MLILGNGRMITRDADNPYLECGAVVIDGTKIVKAGTLSEVKRRIRMRSFWMQRAR